MFGLCDFPHCKCRSQCRPIVTVSSKQKPPGVAPRERFFQYAEGKEYYTVQYEVQMEFCSSHQDNFRDKFIVNDQSWSSIENMLKGYGFAPPDKDSVKIAWVRAAGADGLDDIGRLALEIAHGRELGTHPLTIQTGNVDETKKLASQGLYPKGL